jgi:hypothetical protein
MTGPGPLCSRPRAVSRSPSSAPDRARESPCRTPRGRFGRPQPGWPLAGTSGDRAWRRHLQYSLVVREVEWEIVPAAVDTGLGLLPWSPLGGGWLSGKYRRDERPSGATRLGDNPNRGMEAYDRRGTPRTWEVIDAVQKVARERNVSMAEVALAWVAGRPAVTSTILGARTVEQLDTNLRGWPATHRRGNRRARGGQRPAAHRLPIRQDGGGTARPPHRGR